MPLSWVAFGRKQFGPKVDSAGASRLSTVARTDGRSSPHAAPAGPLAVKCSRPARTAFSLFNWSCVQCYAFAKIAVNAPWIAVKQMFVRASTRRRTGPIQSWVRRGKNPVRSHLSYL